MKYRNRQSQGVRPKCSEQLKSLVLDLFTKWEKTGERSAKNTNIPEKYRIHYRSLSTHCDCCDGLFNENGYEFEYLKINNIDFEDLKSITIEDKIGNKQTINKEELLIEFLTNRAIEDPTKRLNNSEAVWGKDARLL